MHSIARISAFLLSLTLAQPLLAQGPPVKIFGLVELSGTGATSGTNFNDGVKLAVKEINAAGGILGRKVEYTASDTQSQPQVAKALAMKAIDEGAYVVMGPVFSGSILVSMAETRRAEIPNFTGGEAASYHAAGQSLHLPHVVHADHGDAQGGALSERQPEGEDGRDHLDQQRLRQGRPRRVHEGARAAGHQGRRRHLDRSRARSISPGAVLKAKQANADALFVYTNEEEVGAGAARAPQAGLRQADRRRDRAHEPEGDRARGRRGERRGRARRPHRGRARSRHPGFRSEIPEGIQLQAATTTA